MPPTRIAVVVLLVAVAGCTGLAPTDGAETTAPATAPTTELTTEQPTTETTQPHTGVGTSHAPTHLTVRAGAGVENVTVTLAPGGDDATYEVPAGREVDLTREVHDRGHDVHVVVERGGEVVYEADVLEYEYHDVVVRGNDTDVTMSVV